MDEEQKPASKCVLKNGSHPKLQFGEGKNWGIPVIIWEGLQEKKDWTLC